jgi:hypothetical protein
MHLHGHLEGSELEVSVQVFRYLALQLSDITWRQVVQVMRLRR